MIKLINDFENQLPIKHLIIIINNYYSYDDSHLSLQHQIIKTKFEIEGTYRATQGAREEHCILRTL